jgi:nitrite reductase/ring-hydroxylating ferredoxin subunit
MPVTFPTKPYSTGWFHIIDSQDLAVGDVTPVSYFGRDLVCFRTEDGTAHVSDAYCPHLGAHLGYGGSIEGNRLICPFHLWEFDCEGRNTRIPYADKPNRGARLGIYPVVETHGFIFAWYSPSGTEPSWSPADIPIPELDDPSYLPIARTTFEVTVHPQEIMENVLDGAHFVAIHRAKEFPDIKVETDGPWLRSSAPVQMTSKSRTFEGSVDSQLWGLGIDVNRIKGAVDTLTVMTLTPVDETKLIARLTVGAGNSGEVSERLRTASQGMVTSEFELDCVIWNNKRYLASPLLASSEKSIVTFRRWAQQFYSDGGSHSAELKTVAQGA